MTRNGKIVLALSLAVVVFVAALAGAAIAFAQRPTPPTGAWGPGGMMGNGYGRGGMMGGGYGPGGMMGNGYGPMLGGVMSPTVMHTAMAQALDMTLDEFNAAIAAGQTPYQLAQERGVEWATVQAAMTTAMTEQLQQAVADGRITQAQADALLARHAQMQAWHAENGWGNMPGMGGYGGTCPMAVTPVP
jgi:uncharacterized membrane protein